MLGRAAGVNADVRCTRPGAAAGTCWCATASIDPQAPCAHMERCLRRLCVTWERAIPTDEPPASAATLRMRPSRLQMVVVPISSECTAPDDSNTVAPPARWPHSSVLSSSSASRGVSATRRGLRSLPPTVFDIRRPPVSEARRPGVLYSSQSSAPGVPTAQRAAGVACSTPACCQSGNMEPRLLPAAAPAGIEHSETPQPASDCCQRVVRM